MDGTKKTAIIYAVGRAFPAVCTVLLAHGVDVNAKYGNDLTALMWAAGYSAEAGVNDAIDVMTLFIDHGAQLDDQDNRGRTALDDRCRARTTRPPSICCSRAAPTRP